MFFDSEKDVKNIISFFNKINQITKTRSDDTKYYINKNKIFCFTIYYKEIINILDEKNINILNEIKTVIDGKEFFDFLKLYKKNINTIEIKDKNLIFHTDIPEVEFKGHPEEINNFIKIKKRLTKLIKNSKEHFKTEYNKEELIDFAKAKSKFPKLIKIQDSKIKIIKNFIAIKDTKSSFSFQKNIIDEQTSLIIFNQINNFVDVKTYFKITEY